MLRRQTIKRKIDYFAMCKYRRQKRKPMIIDKYQKTRCFKNVNTLEFNYATNRKAWMLLSFFKQEIINWDLELKDRKTILLIDKIN